MLRKKIALIAPHAVAECVELLMPHIDTSFMKLGKQAYAGRLTDSKICIRKRIRYNNGFQTVLEASMLAGADQNQTKIVGHIGLRRATICFGVFWIAFVLLGVVVLSIPTAMDHFSGHPQTVTGNPLIAIFVPPGMLLFTFLLVSFGRWLARREESEITTFLTQTIHATPDING